MSTTKNENFLSWFLCFFGTGCTNAVSLTQRFKTSSWKYIPKNVCTRFTFRGSMFAILGRNSFVMGAEMIELIKIRFCSFYNVRMIANRPVRRKRNSHRYLISQSIFDFVLPKWKPNKNPRLINQSVTEVDTGRRSSRNSTWWMS